jgi:hypothetical protein
MKIIAWLYLHQYAGKAAAHYSRSFFFFAAAGHSNWGIWS